MRVPKFAPGVHHELRDRAAGAGRRRRAAGPRRARAGCCGRPPGRRGASPPTSPPRRCACCRSDEVDAVFLDIRMPGLTGLELARVLRRFRTPPRVVFVTAHEEHAVEAFELDVVDYLLKPVREARLRRGDPPGASRPAAPAGRGDRRRDPGGARRRHPVRPPLRGPLRRGAGRLRPAAHADGSHLVRVPLATLEERWADAGFVRIHRSHLVALAHVERAAHRRRPRAPSSSDGEELRSRRRHTRELRDLLVRRARPGAGRGSDACPTPSRPDGPPRRVRVTSPRTVARPAAAPVTADLGDRRADPARRDLHVLAAARPAAPGGRRPGRRARGASPACRCCSRSFPGLTPRPAARHAAAVGAARRSPSTRSSSCAAGSTSAAAEQQRARLRTMVDPPDAVEDGDAVSPPYGVVAVALVAVATLAIGAYGWRLSRTTSDFFVASRSVRPALNAARSAASTSRPPRSSASPGWCSRSAPTCCGTRSAGPPATCSCWCWSPHRCAARAPTPARLRRGAAGVGAGPPGVPLLVVVDRLALPDAAVPGRRPVARHRRRQRALGGRAARRRGRARQRALRRDAQHHVRAGVPVLAQADRAARARRCSCVSVWHGDGGVSPALGATEAGVTGAEWSQPTADGRPRALHDVLAHPGDVPRHDGAAARGGPLLHQPRRPGGPPHDAGGARRCSALFYLLPPVYGALGRIYAPDLVAAGRDRHRRAGAARTDGRRARRRRCCPRWWRPARSRRSSPPRAG